MYMSMSCRTIIILSRDADLATRSTIATRDGMNEKHTDGTTGIESVNGLMAKRISMSGVAS